jgi:hypothetical protein
MKENGNSVPKRPIIARDGTVYFIRRLVGLGRSVGFYVPPQILEAAKLDAGECVMIWVQGEVICMKALEIASPAQRLIPLPPRGRRKDQVPRDEEA